MSDDLEKLLKEKELILSYSMPIEEKMDMLGSVNRLIEKAKDKKNKQECKLSEQPKSTTN